MADVSVLLQRLPVTRHSPQRTYFPFRAALSLATSWTWWNERATTGIASLRIISRDAHQFQTDCQGRDDRVSPTWRITPLQWQSPVGLQTFGSASKRLLFCSIPDVPWWCPKPSSNHSAYLRVRGTRCRGRAPWLCRLTTEALRSVIPRRRSDNGVTPTR